MQAIILAAGMGKRLKELTRDNTKCMVKVNGVSLIERLLGQLEPHGLSQIVIVVGYRADSLIEYVKQLNIKTPVIFIHNPVYDKTNNIYSLALAKQYLCREDTLLFESDIIFDETVLKEIIEDPRETLALVDKYESWMDGTCLTLTEDDRIESFISKKEFRFCETDRYYKTVNIYKFSKGFSKTYYVPFLDAYSMALGNNEYYEQVLRVIAILDQPLMKAKRLNGQRWYEIDDVQDLDIASCLFSGDEKDRAFQLRSRYGGFWRFPKLTDFCYLVNPYYPTQRLKEELRANFDCLLTNYPSGMRVNALIAAKNFNVCEMNLVVGNGAAELIKAVMELISGKIGLIRPTFEEYPNRCDSENLDIYIPRNEDFSYDADHLIAHFGDKNINCLIVINPDNPSGNYIKKTEMLRLISWTKERGIRLLVDESFVDFADEENSSLIEQELLEANRHLIVIKSISKSYGIPGLRLGILVSGDSSLIEALKKDVSIWNINSFAEFYMQIAEKYEKEYADSLVKIKQARKLFADALNQIPKIRILPSQANYVMAEVLGGMLADELERKLLANYNIVIKNLNGKLMETDRQYVRIAVRSREDNDRLALALNEVMNIH